MLDWDGKALGFGGEVMPGNHIELMEVPDDAFAVALEHVVPTFRNVDHLLSGNPAVEVLGLFTAGDPDTESLKCRKMVPVPAAYLHLLLDRTLTPCQLWEQVGGVIIADAKEMECGVLLSGFEQPSPREVAWRRPHYACLAHPPRAVERGLSTDPGGAGVAGGPLGGASH